MPDTALNAIWGTTVAREDIREGDRWFTNTDKTFTFTVRDDAGVAKNVTGWTLSWVVKRTKETADASAIVTKTTTAGGITIVNAAAGIVRVTIAAADTDATVKARVYWHELKRTDTGLKAVLTHGLAVLRRGAHLSS